MSIRWWNPFDGMEQIAFKPELGGYVYRAPNPWLFGRGRYYLVNEAEKAELAVHHRRALRFTFLVILVGAALGGPLLGSFAPSRPAITLAVAALIGLAVGFVINVLLARSLAPIVAKLTPTRARITQRDAFKQQVAVFSRRYLLGFIALEFVMFALVVASATFGPQGWDLTAMVGTALFGLGAVYFVALYVAKLKQAAS
jgi:hypothetical protein